MHIDALTLLIAFIGLFLIVGISIMGYLWMQHHQQQSLLLQWLHHAEDKLAGIETHIETFTQLQDLKQNQWGLLLEKRLSTHDAHNTHLLQLGHKIEYLSTIMSHDSHRGAYGETQLEFLLRDMFPEKLLKLQYTLSTQRRVDAALWLGPMERWLCIDAKFPLEDFQSTVHTEDAKRFKSKIKKHIKDISDRYIVAGETTDMAVLFLPAEGLFVWLHHYAADILQYAHTLNIWLASPSTLPSLLHIILSLMKNHQIDQLSQQFMKEFQHILALVATTSITIGKLDKSLSTHQQHLWTLTQQHQSLYHTLKNIDNTHSTTSTPATLQSTENTTQ